MHKNEAMFSKESIQPKETNHTGQPVRTQPQPADDNYSGTLTIQIPRSLHRQLSKLAEEEGVSLDQYILYKLSSVR